MRRDIETPFAHAIKYTMIHLFHYLCFANDVDVRCHIAPMKLVEQGDHMLKPW